MFDLVIGFIWRTFSFVLLMKLVSYVASDWIHPFKRQTFKCVYFIYQNLLYIVIINYRLNVIDHMYELYLIVVKL